MDLLGGVGQVEVEREGAHQVRGLLDRQGAQQFADLGDDVVRAPRAGGVGAAAGGFLGFLGQQADLLHEVKEFGPVLADQGFAQEGGDPADVCPAVRRQDRIRDVLQCEPWKHIFRGFRTWLVHCAGYCEPRY